MPKRGAGWKRNAGPVGTSMGCVIRVPRWAAKEINHECALYREEAEMYNQIAHETWERFKPKVILRKLRG